MKFYRAIIHTIDNTTQPYDILLKPYDLKEPLILDSGHVLNSDPIKRSVFLVDSVGRASRPQAGDQVLCFETGSMTETWGICVDWKDKPDRDINEVCEGNFKTKNFIRINDNEFLIQEEGTERVFVDTKSVEFTTSIQHLIQTELFQIISNTTAEITGDEVSITGTSKADITSALISLIGTTRLGSNTATKGVARIGDTVDLVPASPTYGKITTGSTTVTAED